MLLAKTNLEMDQDLMIKLIMIVCAVIVLFFIVREIVCWYYKINERVRLQNEMVCYLKVIADSKKEIHTCKHCGLVSKVNAHFCPGCDMDNLGKVKADYKPSINIQSKAN